MGECFLSLYITYISTTYLEKLSSLLFFAPQPTHSTIIQLCNVY